MEPKLKAPLQNKELKIAGETLLRTVSNLPVYPPPAKIASPILVESGPILVGKLYQVFLTSVTFALFLATVMRESAVHRDDVGYNDAVT